jgi:hypothetical protein
MADRSLELIKEKIVETKDIVKSMEPSGRH